MLRSLVLFYTKVETRL